MSSVVIASFDIQHRFFIQLPFGHGKWHVFPKQLTYSFGESPFTSLAKSVSFSCSSFSGSVLVAKLHCCVSESLCCHDSFFSVFLFYGCFICYHISAPPKGLKFITNKFETQITHSNEGYYSDQF